MIKPAMFWTLISLAALGFSVRAEELPDKQRKAIDTGLDWLAKTQNRDGYWGPAGRKHSTSLTARSGLVMLMHGSNLRQGKYKDNLLIAVDWLVENCQADGLIRNRNDRAEANDYMEGHGFAMLFLASVCLQEKDGKQRKQLKEVLTRAVDFCGKAQTDLGGWNYVSAKDAGGNLDVGDLAVTQMQALRACQDAGINGTKPILAKAHKYLEKCTTKNGGVVFCLATGREGERPNLTAAALVAGFSAGQYDSDLVKKWLKYCTFNIVVGHDGLTDPDGYIRYYFPQALRILGDDGYQRLFPNSRPEERLTWSKYKEHAVEPLIASQSKDGSWKGRNDDLLFTTINLTILQLDTTSLPIYRRTAMREEAPKN